MPDITVVYPCPESGRYAGQTAAGAVKGHDVTEKRLASYNVLCERPLESKTDISIAHFVGLSEEGLKEFFNKMTKVDGHYLE